MSEIQYYSPQDFIKAAKFDAHLHYHTFDDSFVRKAEKINLRLLSVNTNFDFSIEKQFEICRKIKQQHPQTFDFIATFDTRAFSSKTFAQDAVNQIKNAMAAGALGIKIWKNIGMKLKNAGGQFVMADDPAFEPIFAFLEKEKIPLLTHLGDPRNCWLPREQTSIRDDARYYKNHPEFHAYAQADIPAYEKQIAARDRLLERFPKLTLVGAHLGSMEWNLDEATKRLDKFPQFYLDISACFDHIFLQALRDKNRVADFFEKYQDRIIYGSDFFVSKYNERKWLKPCCKCFPQLYSALLFKYMQHKLRKHWLFLASDQTVKIGKISNQAKLPGQIKGIKLSKKIIDRIFYQNANFVYRFA